MHVLYIHKISFYYLWRAVAKIFSLVLKCITLPLLSMAVVTWWDGGVGCFPTLVRDCGCSLSFSLSNRALNRLLISNVSAQTLLKPKAGVQIKSLPKLTFQASLPLWNEWLLWIFWFCHWGATSIFGLTPCAANPASMRAWSLIKESTRSTPKAKPNSTLFPSLSVYHYASVLCP